MSPGHPPRPADRRRQGVVLALVMILGLLLTTAVVTFQRRALVDVMIVRNRDAAARAEALARGGVRLGRALVLEDQLAKTLSAGGIAGARPATPGNTEDDLWNQVGNLVLEDAEGGRLRVSIRDTGGLLNLNAILPYTGTAEPIDPDAEEFLVEVLSKVVDEMAIPPGEKLYDPREMARNLIDYMDFDDVRISGGPEAEYYLSQDPPSRPPPNQPFLSVEELGLVEGFDVQMVNALRPYLTVEPVVGASGINLNTAPPHVLSLVYHGVSGSRRLADEDLVRRILEARAEDRVVCTGGEGGGGGSSEVPAGTPREATPLGDRCVSLIELGFDEGSIYPPANLPATTAVFRIRSEGVVDEIRRTVIATLDVSTLTEPRLLSWRMQ